MEFIQSRQVTLIKGEKTETLMWDRLNHSLCLYLFSCPTSSTLSLVATQLTMVVDLEPSRQNQPDLISQF